MRGLLLALCVAAVSVSVQAAPLRHEVLDDFRDASAWAASASDQVRATLRPDRDGSLCLDVDFAGVSGYGVMRRALPMSWPQRFELVARLKGAGATNDFQFKLVDASGDNVWWANRPDAALPNRLTDVKIRRRQIDFAWGPAGDRALRQTQFVEFVLAAGRDGGRQSLCLSRLTLVERAPEPQPWPAPRLQAAALRLDLDYGQAREFKFFAPIWPAAPRGLDYEVLGSHDGRRWRKLRGVRGSDGGFDALFLPESEARHLRIRWHAPAARPRVELRSAAEWPNANAVLASLAAQAPRGDLPRAFVGEQNYWTLVGVDGGGPRSALLSEDGALEVGRGGYSLEPAVWLGAGSPVTWSGVTLTHSLRDGYLPLPAVHWRHAAFTLDIEAGADGPRDAPELLARYRLRNTGARTQAFNFMLAVRPWQVNPPQQFLATPGGASPIRRLRWNGAMLAVNGRPALRFSASAQRVAALSLDGGVSLAALQAAPARRALHDPQGQASAALQWRIKLAPGASHVLGLTAGLGAGGFTGQGRIGTEARMDAAAARWRERLNRTTLRLPPAAQPIFDTLRTSLAHILMSRDGPALQPGTRSYARSWVRDGAMMVASLVQLGEADAAREYVDWYAGHIFASGKVPCCVDQRGADPVAENDSHGQYLYAVAEVWRHTHDRAFLLRHWPQVQRVTAWLEQLRQSQRGAANRTPERARLFGLMPASISHEGYSDKPAYSYWDDFWALRGYKDAVLIAQALGQPAVATTWAQARDEFERELVASIAATAAHYRIEHIAGAADRGDFDPTSTTIALNPAQAEVPADLLRATFERYWLEMNARAQGQRAWQDYTPYELRTVGALTRLGWPDRAHAMLRFFFNHQRPRGWNQWAEVVLPDRREVRFLGDMPHAWVASDYIRSALDLFAYERPQADEIRRPLFVLQAETPSPATHERAGARSVRAQPPEGVEQSGRATVAQEREAEHSLVIGAGLAPDWLAQGDIEVSGLSTPYGRLDYRLLRIATGWRLELPHALAGLQGGMHLAWPGAGALPRASHNGRALVFNGRELRLPDAPAVVQLDSD